MSFLSVISDSDVQRAIKLLIAGIELRRVYVLCCSLGCFVLATYCNAFLDLEEPEILIVYV